MPTTKLTLSADKELIRQAKKLAEEEGTSLSSMFSRFLQAVLRERRKPERLGPLTRQALGLAKLPPDKCHKDYRELLEEALTERYGL
jgi:hypothetical protein